MLYNTNFIRILFNILNQVNNRPILISNLLHGKAISLEYIIVLAIGVLLMIKLISNYKKNIDKKPEAKPKITFQEIILSKIGKLKPIGNNTYVGGKLLSKKNDVETYLTVTKIDRSYIRKEEQEKAKANYKKYKRIIALLIFSLIIEYLILKFI